MVSCAAGTDWGCGMSSGSFSMVVGMLAAFSVGICGDGLGGFSAISWCSCSMSVGTGRVGVVVLNRNVPFCGTFWLTVSLIVGP